MTIIEKLADWVFNLKYEDIPKAVIEKAKLQILSVAGANHAGARSSHGAKLLAALGEKGEGASTILAGGRKTSAENAAYINAALSMSLDYDDYLFLGHTGHSSVCASLAVAEEQDADGKSLLCAVVAANEIGGRAGAACLLGPHNGQMWTSLHLLATAAAIGKLRGLGADHIAEAIAISLSGPPFASLPTFMGSEAKMLIASEPMMCAMRAVDLAEKGLRGRLDAIEHPKGWLADLSYSPLPMMFTGLGEAWVLHTIAYKQYPGCAYIDSTIDALLAVIGDYKNSEGAPINIENIEKITVDASFLTVEMDALSKEYLDRDNLSAININFAIPENVAITLMTGRLVADDLSDEFLGKNRETINRLAAKVELRHDWDQTLNLVEQFDRRMDIRGLASHLTFGEARKVRGSLKSRLGRGIDLAALYELKDSSPESRKYARSLGGRLVRSLISGSDGRFDLGTSDFENMKMAFSSRVTVRLAGGREFTRFCEIPEGAPGAERYLEIPAEKWRREAAALGKQAVKAGEKITRESEKNSARQIAQSLSGVKTK